MFIQKSMEQAKVAGFLTPEDQAIRRAQELERIKKMEILPPGFLLKEEQLKEKFTPTKEDARTQNLMFVIGAEVIPKKKKRGFEGLPLKYKSENELAKAVSDYFAESDRIHNPLTITGLALWLDTSKETFDDVLAGKYGFPFFFVISQAYLRIENYCELQLFLNKNTTGALAYLHHWFSWSAQKKDEITATVNVNSAQAIEEADEKKG